jgi:hypothetical protein
MRRWSQIETTSIFKELKMSKKVKPVGDKEIKKTRVIFNASSYDYLMRANGCSVGFNMPEALDGDTTFGLPPYRKRMPYLVDKFPACPTDWMRSEGKLKSYFVPVIEGDGMWLDFNNNESNTHHVAIVVSVQGINPITGLPCNDAHLEQYIEECPKHKIKFGPDRYCKKCDYKWPKQNYICTTGTPEGYLWLDGFRAADGIVRQYLLTAEKIKGVASNIIGKDRVFAIGVSFFLSKDKRPPRQEATRTFSASGSLGSFPLIQATPNWQYHDNGSSGDYFGLPIDTGSHTDTYDFDTFCDTKGLSDDLGTIKGGNERASCLNTSSVTSKSFESKKAMKELAKKMVSPVRRKGTEPIQAKKLEIGAGAKISQLVYDDPEKLDFWHNEPESIICINYCLEAEARKIIEGGMIDIEGSKEGFLQDIPVGN